MAGLSHTVRVTYGVVVVEQLQDSSLSLVSWGQKSSNKWSKNFSLVAWSPHPHYFLLEAGNDKL